jgi:hypothetical protein
MQTGGAVLLHHEPMLGFFLQLGRRLGGFLKTAFAFVFV